MLSSPLPGEGQGSPAHLQGQVHSLLIQLQDLVGVDTSTVVAMLSAEPQRMLEIIVPCMVTELAQPAQVGQQ